jgi:hypothetical protein
MAKDEFGLGISSASTAAYVEAAKQSLRLMDSLGDHSALKAQMQLSSSIAYSPALREAIENQTAMVQRMKLTFAPPRMPVIPSLALMAGIQEGAERAIKMQSMLMSSSLTQAAAARAAAQALAAHRSSFEAAHAALRDNQLLFSRSSEMLRAAREGVATLRAMESPQASSLTAVLRGIRLDQPRFKSIVASLATATIADLEPEEAQGVATAFEEAVTAQAGAVVGTDTARGAVADQLVLGELSERLHEAFIARLPPERAGGSSIINLDRLISIVLLLLALATYNNDIDNSKSDVRNTEEITSRQDENNELLRSLLEEFRKHPAISVPKIRLVDREASLLQRPAKGAAVIAVVPEGAQVAVIDVWGRWVEITYLDPAAEEIRTGWVLKKYLE